VSEHVKALEDESVSPSLAFSSLIGLISLSSKCYSSWIGVDSSTTEFVRAFRLTLQKCSSIEDLRLAVFPLLSDQLTYRKYVYFIQAVGCN